MDPNCTSLGAPIKMSPSLARNLLYRRHVGMPIAHGLGRDAGTKPYHAAYGCNSPRPVSGERYVDVLSLARAVALVRREQDAEIALRPQSDIDDGYQERKTRDSICLGAVHAHQTAIGLPHRVITRFPPQWAVGAGTADREEHKPREFLCQHRVIESPNAQSVPGNGLSNRTSAASSMRRTTARPRCFARIDFNARLVEVHGGEMAGCPSTRCLRSRRPCRYARRQLDLDHGRRRGWGPSARTAAPRAQCASSITRSPANAPKTGSFG